MQINLTMDTDTNILNTSGCREGGRRGGGLRSGLDIGSIYPSYYLIYCVKPYTLHTIRIHRVIHKSGGWYIADNILY